MIQAHLALEFKQPLHPPPKHRSELRVTSCSNVLQAKPLDALASSECS